MTLAMQAGSGVLGSDSEDVPPLWTFGTLMKTSLGVPTSLEM